MRFPLSLTRSMGSYIFRQRLAGRRMFPLVLMLEPLHACNLSCAGCGRIREYADSVRCQMSLRDCFDAVRECGAPLVSVCGGEPLIYPHIAELINGLIGMGRHVYLCTNGLILEQKLDEFTPSSRLIFNVHLDGQEQAHDAIVQRKGTFALALSGITAAKQRGFLVSTNTTVYRETDMADIEGLFARLTAISVDCHMISPGYDYEAVRNGELFLTRIEVAEKFRNLKEMAGRFPLSNTPLYTEFLMGERDLPCSAWGNPTVNSSGWRSPCYMLADTHYPTFRELMSRTDWSAYGPGRDARCSDCMVHCGFEPSVVLRPGIHIRDTLRLAMWQMS